MFWPALSARHSSTDDAAGACKAKLTPCLPASEAPKGSDTPAFAARLEVELGADAAVPLQIEDLVCEYATLAQWIDWRQGKLLSRLGNTSGEGSLGRYAGKLFTDDGQPRASLNDVFDVCNVTSSLIFFWH